MNSVKRKVKRKLFFASPYEIEAIENFLEQEAANGWMFIKASGMFFVFEECEPIRLKFQVDYFDKATIFDTNPEAETKDYIEYCKESGWQHVFSSGKMQIFYSTEEDPIPIQTDEHMKFKLISKATILVNWISWILLPLLMINNLVLPLLIPRNYFSYSRSVTDFMGFGMGVFCLGFSLLSVISMVRFGIFYIRNIRRLKNGLEIKFYNSKNVKRFGVFYKLYILCLILFLAIIIIQDTFSIGMLLVICIIGIFIPLLINKLMFSKRANRQINIGLTIGIPIVVMYVFILVYVFGIMGTEGGKVSSGNSTYFYSTEDIDLRLDDLGFDKPDNFLYEETIRQKDKTFFGMRQVYSDYCHKDDKSYGYSIEILSSKFSSIMEKYNKLVLEDKNYAFTVLTASDDTWYSNKVFCGRNNNTSMYVVMGEGKTFVITGDLNEAQAAELSSYYMKNVDDWF